MKLDLLILCTRSNKGDAAVERSEEIEGKY